jgi:hypothetical protein
MVYIPSVTNTILQLRCGAIPTLHNNEFNKLFKTGQEDSSILPGSLFWGTILSAVTVGGVVGVIVFFFLWQATAYLAQKLVAIVIGLVTITLLHNAIFASYRRKFYSAFYREHPAKANISGLFNEWCNFALSAGYIALRLVKMLLTGAAYLGRIDRQFQAPGVGTFGKTIELDSYPTVHTKDVLSHEAHRHPYIELLGSLYILKLRYGDNFGTRAGSAWRLLFIYALFPWLHTYRLSTRPEILDAVNKSSDVMTGQVMKSARVDLKLPSVDEEEEGGEEMLYQEEEDAEECGEEVLYQEEDGTEDKYVNETDEDFVDDDDLGGVEDTPGYGQPSYQEAPMSRQAAPVNYSEGANDQQLLHMQQQIAVLQQENQKLRRAHTKDGNETKVSQGAIKEEQTARIPLPYVADEDTYTDHEKEILLEKKVKVMMAENNLIRELEGFEIKIDPDEDSNGTFFAGTPSKEKIPLMEKKIELLAEENLGLLAPLLKESDEDSSSEGNTSEDESSEEESTKGESSEEESSEEVGSGDERSKGEYRAKLKGSIPARESLESRHAIWLRAALAVRQGEQPLHMLNSTSPTQCDIDCEDKQSVANRLAQSVIVEAMSIVDELSHGDFRKGVSKTLLAQAPELFTTLTTSQRGERTNSTLLEDESDEKELFEDDNVHSENDDDRDEESNNEYDEGDDKSYYDEGDEKNYYDESDGETCDASVALSEAQSQAQSIVEEAMSIVHELTSGGLLPKGLDTSLLAQAAELLDNLSQSGRSQQCQRTVTSALSSQDDEDSDENEEFYDDEEQEQSRGYAEESEEQDEDDDVHECDDYGEETYADSRGNQSYIFRR